MTEPDPDEIAQFLSARLDDDEAFMEATIRLRSSMAAADAPVRDGAASLLDVVLDDPDAVEALSVFTRTGVRAPGEAERVLAEVAVKRRVVDEFTKEQWVMEQGHRTGWTEGGQSVRGHLIREWAALYDKHPEYKEAWRP